nr:copia protein [Tanacetum cinerariifolium]
MRIEQYFLMTDYLLWERLARKNELKAHGSLLMALPDKHQLKLNTHKDAKTLMEEIEKSTNEPVSAVASVSAVSAKIPISALPNVDTLSNAVIYSFFASQGQEGILKQMDLLPWDLICPRWSVKTATEKDTLQGSVGMTRVFKQMRNLPTMFLWPSLLQVLFLIMRYQSGNGYHVVPSPYTGTFMPPKPDLVFYNAPNDVETVHTAFNVKLSPTKPDNDLSHTHRPSKPSIEDWVSDSEDEFETKIPQNVPSNGNHGNRKACFVCKSLDHLFKDCDYHEKKLAQTTARNHAPRGHHKNYASMPLLNPQRHVVPTAVVPKSKLVPINAARPNTAAVLKPHVTRLRPDKGVIDIGCSRHVTRNMSYLSNFEELNGGYVAFGGNPKGGKISGKKMCNKKNSVLFTNIECLVLSPEFKLPDENQVLLRVHRENNMYNVDLKNIVPFGDLTCLFANATLDESNLWHRMPGHINFKTMIKLVKEKSREENVQQYVLFPVWSFGSINPQNTNGDATFDKKEHEFEGRKHESEVNVSPSSSAQSKKHDDKTKREAKGKIPVVGQLYPNSTNTFSAAGPSNASLSPTHRKSSYVDSFQLLDDLNMPELEDITYSDDEDDVSAEADLNNLETSITVSPIPTTRFHKDHPMTQIIGGASLIQDAEVRYQARLVAQRHTQEKGINYEEVFAPVARIEAIRLFLAYASFMGFMVYQIDVKSAFMYETIEEEVYVYQPLGFEDPGYRDKVYKVVKALYGLHQAPRVWYETLANYLLENGFQRGKIDQTLFIKRQKDGKSASTPIDTEKPLVKDPDVKRIFRYLKGKPHLGLWYLKDSPFKLVAYSDSDYAGASLDRKSTTGGCQFLGCRLISWQCKKQTIVATSSTEADFGLTMQVALSGMEYLKRLLHVTNILSAGYLTTPQMVLNSPCLTQIKNLLVQIKRSVSSVSVKKVNDVSRLQALIDIKKVIITKAAIRDALCLDDAEGRKFNFSKYIFDSLVRNVDSPTKFYMYTRFLHLMIRKQVGDLSLHSTKYASPTLTQKVFANIRRVGKGFFVVETPLFEGMIVERQVGEGAAEVNVKDVFTAVLLLKVLLVLLMMKFLLLLMNHLFHSLHHLLNHHHHHKICLPLPKVEHLEHDKIAQALEITKLKQRGRMIADMDADKDMTLKDVVAKDVQDAEIEESSDVQGRKAESQAQIYQIDLKHADKVLRMQDDEGEPTELQEVVKVVTTAKFITEVVTAASATITDAAPQLNTAAAPTLITAPSAARRRKGVVIRDPEETATLSTIIHSKAKSKDKGKRILKEDNAVKRYQALKKKPQTEAQARKNMMIYLRNQKTKEQMEEEDSRALKRLSESQEDKASKKQKLDEEVKELKKHLMIVSNDDDDVYTEATPVAFKVLVVDYEICTKNNKPYYKIKRVNGSHQLYLSFLSMLRNFDREDLEVL